MRAGVYTFTRNHNILSLDPNTQYRLIRRALQAPSTKVVCRLISLYNDLMS